MPCLSRSFEHIWWQHLKGRGGIVLGFILNFATSFVKLESVLSDFASNIIGFCILLAIVCLIIVLKLVLTMNYPKENAEKYYIKILNLFISGVSIVFFVVMIDMFVNVYNHLK